MNKILIVNGSIINRNKTNFSDILIKGAFIEKIDKRITDPGAEIIDASGKFIFPGIIDVRELHPDSGFRTIRDTQEITVDKFSRGSKNELDARFAAYTPGFDCLQLLDTPERFQMFLYKLFRRHIVFCGEQDAGGKKNH